MDKMTNRITKFEIDQKIISQNSNRSNLNNYFNTIVAEKMI